MHTVTLPAPIVPVPRPIRPASFWERLWAWCDAEAARRAGAS